MKLVLHIVTGNAGVLRTSDLAKLLEKTAKKLRALPMTPDGGKIMDVNGNSVGEWELLDDA